jgi:glycine betaine transporter
MEVKSLKKKMRWGVFLPSFVIVIAILVLNLTNYDLFLTTMDLVINWILINFSWLFNTTVLFALAIVLIVYFSPIKDVRFGGSKCKPMLRYSNFVWIVLCTIMGSGLMLWACAEPIYHMYSPPANVTSGPLSGEAILWAMENIFLEWTFSPMAIYALPTVLFAFVFYNMRKPFAIGSMLSPVLMREGTLDDSRTKKVTPIVDSFCLLSLCMGMAASLGTGILLATGGLNKITNGTLTSSTTTLIISAIAIVAAFVISASSGLMRGIRILSNINAYIYFLLGFFVFLFGPTIYLLDLCVESFGTYLSDFFKISLWTSAAWGDGWSRWWPTFYWCTWLAWMPVSAAFLGRIAKGYTVRETLNVVFIIPSVFSIVWITIFSGTAINFELAGQGLYEAMQSGGVAAATYTMLDKLPLSMILIPLFLFTAILSYVTSADSNTSAIAGLCTEGLTTEDTESPIILKVVWGLTIGALSLIMLLSYDIEGVKMLSYLGGLPVVFLMILFMVGMVRIMRNPKKYDTYSEDYDENGRPIPSNRLPYEGQESEQPSFFTKLIGDSGTTTD